MSSRSASAGSSKPLVKQKSIETVGYSDFAPSLKKSGRLWGSALPLEATQHSHQSSQGQWVSSWIWRSAFALVGVEWIVLELHLLLPWTGASETHCAPAPLQGSLRSAGDGWPVCAMHHPCLFHVASRRVMKILVSYYTLEIQNKLFFRFIIIFIITKIIPKIITKFPEALQGCACVCVCTC